MSNAARRMRVMPPPLNSAWMSVELLLRAGIEWHTRGGVPLNPSGLASSGQLSPLLRNRFHERDHASLCGGAVREPRLTEPCRIRGHAHNTPIAAIHHARQHGMQNVHRPVKTVAAIAGAGLAATLTADAQPIGVLTPSIEFSLYCAPRATAPGQTGC